MKRLFYTLLFFCIALSSAFGQTPDSVSKAYIQMKSELRDGKVLLRWAPTSARLWSQLNKHGVRLERATVMSDGKILDEEPVMLIDTLKPVMNADFIQAAETYSYAAIIAQAVFGETFEVVGSDDPSVATLIALGEELQQRYVMSLYAADLCFPAALAAGWGWEDPNVTENEKYLYRVVPLIPEETPEVETGGLVVDMGRKIRYPKPLDFRAEFGDQQAKLIWNYRVLGPLYNAYVLERSTDGIQFSPVSDTPITELGAGSTGQIFHVDSIRNNAIYYYRLSGLTIFGTRGEYSDVVSGQGIRELQNSPFITLAVPDENGGARIEWQFDEADEEIITGFTLERSNDDKQYTDWITDIRKTERRLTVSDILPTNYYKVRANTILGQAKSSFSVLVQAVDTLPPAIPQGLQAEIDSMGCVRLSWLPNTDADIHGYRLYKGQTAEEELFPLNDIAIQECEYVDSVNMQMLNPKAYYAIAALDARYNQSDLSPVIEAVKPEVIPPTPPFIRLIEAENGLNRVHWVSGGEPAIVGYDVYRRAEEEHDFALLVSLSGAGTMVYEDTEVENNLKYTYRICSRTAGLVSEPSHPYAVRAIRKMAVDKTKIEFTIIPRQDRFLLKWKNIPADVVAIQIYKQTGDGALELYREMSRDSIETEDTHAIPGTSYQYMLVVKTNGSAPQSIAKEVKL